MSSNKVFHQTCVSDFGKCQLDMILFTRSDLCRLQHRYNPIGDQEHFKLSDRDKHCSNICPNGGTCRKTSYPGLCVEKDKNCVCMCYHGEKYDTLRRAWVRWLLRERPAQVKEPCPDEPVEEAIKRRWDAEVKPTIVRTHEGSKRLKSQSYFWQYLPRSMRPAEINRDEIAAHLRDLEKPKSEHELRANHKRDERRECADLACDKQCPREMTGSCSAALDGGMKRCLCKRKEDAKRTGSKGPTWLPLASARAMWSKDPCDPKLTFFTDYCERACPCTMRGLCLSEDGQSHGDFCFCYEHNEKNIAKLDDMRDKCACTGLEHFEECCVNCLAMETPEYTPHVPTITG